MSSNKHFKHRRIIRDSIQGITKPAILRLAHRAGIPSISGLVYEPVRVFIKNYLEELLRDVGTIIDYSRVKTVKSDHVRLALEFKGVTVAATSNHGELGHTYQSKPRQENTQKDENKREHRWRHGTVALREVRKIQKSSAGLIRWISFVRLVREIMEDYKTYVRFSREALEIIKLYIESRIITLLQKAALCMLHAKRSILKYTDIYLARDLIES